MSSLGFFSVFFLPYSHIYRKEMFVYCFLCHFIQGFIWWDFIMNFIHNDFFKIELVFLILDLMFSYVQPSSPLLFF